ncbi:MAG: DUF1178 family protein [Alphaproteobacteria bacterium]
MILFDLKCQSDHVFEAWFRDGATFEKQSAAGEIACPICGETRVAKAPMAPHVTKCGSESGDGPKLVARGSAESALARELSKELARLYRHIEDACDYVGKQFPDEARKIHYGESERRDIFGEASEEETRALLEEGVAVFRLPWVRRRQDS